MRRALAVIGVAALCLTAACGGGGPTVHATIGPGTAFCDDLATFASSAVSLTDAAHASRDTLLGVLPPVHAMLLRLEAEAPKADSVDGVPVTEDLHTLASVYGEVIAELQRASPTDVGAVPTVLKAANDKYGKEATSAVNRLDAYASTACHVTGGTQSPSTA